MTRITRDGVAIEWRGAGLAERMGVQVERRGRRGAWTAIGAPLATGPDRLTFVDRSAVSGEWAYRLRAGEWSTSETWVQLPDERLAMRMLGSSSGSMRVELSLPRAGAVTLDVFDAGGRRVASPELGSLEAGRHERSVDTRSLRTGIYWLRLRQEEHDVTARAIVSR
jgi:hypothetical protein